MARVDLDQANLAAPDRRIPAPAERAQGAHVADEVAEVAAAVAEAADLKEILAGDSNCLAAVVVMLGLSLVHGEILPLPIEPSRLKCSLEVNTDNGFQ